MGRHGRGNTSSRKEEQALVAGVVFVILFVGSFAIGFVRNCIFEWPIRWDVGTCWDEQKAPAKQKAIEGAMPLLP